MREKNEMSATMLSGEAFEASRRFVETAARPLEIARFHHHFERASEESVLAALKEYRNADGGFGHALEPDLRAAESSALCTSIAFQVLRSTGAKPDGVVIPAGIRYLLETLDREKWHWRIIPRSAGQSPHAPWWNQADHEDVFDRFSLNPTAEILGYLYDCQPQIPGGITTHVSDRVINHLSGLEKIDMHELLCCLRLLKTKTLPEDARDQIRRQLTRFIGAAVTRDPEQWTGYNLRPLQVADDPGSPFMAGLEEDAAANLDYEISSQNRDGSWTPTWTWGNAFPEDWAKAQREWSGIITLDKLLLLKRFGRIEGIA
jgi:hypothetical protein